MSREDANEFASQVVKWLAQLDVEAIQAREDIRKVLLDLVDRSETLRKEVTSHLKANNTPPPRSPSQIGDYLAQCSYSGPASRGKALANMTKALNCLRSDLSVPIKKHRLSKATEDLHDASSERRARCRQEGVMKRFRKHESTTIITESMRRLLLLRVSYEVDRLLPTIQKETTDKSDIAAAEREFSRLSGEPEGDIRKLRELARPYLTLANRKNGLGVLLMLGTQSRDLWENRVRDEAIKWLWMFCRSNEKEVMERAEALQPIACEIMLADFSEYGAHANELWQDGHVFSRHFMQTDDVGVVQNSDSQHATVPASASASAPREIEQGMADYGLYERNPSSQWQPCNQIWPQDSTGSAPQYNHAMGSGFARVGENSNNVEGIWDWDNLIQETYTHLRGVYTG